ncbi:MAG: Wzz/FepE/Etk N-terminal domain-containing protein [Phycisphaerae bacterium]|jgi:uncharacterized protein involved in exopolysaccharide biosynthesis
MAETYTSRTLREIVRVLASRFWAMLFIFVLVAAAAVAVTFLSPKSYRSDVSFWARPGATSPLEEQGNVLRDRVSLFVVTQREIIMSDYVLASAVMNFKGVPKAEPVAANSSAAPTTWYDDKVVSDFITRNSKLLDTLRTRVKVITPGGPDATFTQTYKIRVDWSQRNAMAFSPDPSPARTAEETAKLADCIKNAYLMRYTFLESQRTREATQLLQQQSLAAARLALDEATGALNDFIKSELKGDLLQVINMGSTVGSSETGTATLVTQFSGELGRIDQRLAEVTALKKAVDVELAKTDLATMVVPDAVTSSNPLMAKLQTQIVQTQLELNALSPRYTESFQKLQTLRSELAAARQDLHGELAKQSTRLDQEIATLTAQHQTLTRKIAEDRQRNDDLAAKVARYGQLTRSVDAAQAIFNDEQKRVVSAITAEKLAANPVLVTTLDEATRPDPKDPRLPIVWLNMVVGGIAALVLSLVYAFMADHFDHSIKSIDGAERYLGTVVLASVPKLGRKIIRVTRGD